MNAKDRYHDLFSLWNGIFFTPSGLPICTRIFYEWYNECCESQTTTRCSRESIIQYFLAIVLRRRKYTRKTHGCQMFHGSENKMGCGYLGSHHDTQRYLHGEPRILSTNAYHDAFEFDASSKLLIPECAHELSLETFPDLVNGLATTWGDEEEGEVGMKLVDNKIYGYEHAGNYRMAVHFLIFCLCQECKWGEGGDRVNEETTIKYVKIFEQIQALLEDDVPLAWSDRCDGIKCYYDRIQDRQTYSGRMVDIHGRVSLRLFVSNILSCDADAPTFTKDTCSTCCFCSTVDRHLTFYRKT